MKKLSVGKKFKICMLTKATAATQAQAPHLREKFGILLSILFCVYFVFLIDRFFFLSIIRYFD